MSDPIHDAVLAKVQEQLSSISDGETLAALMPLLVPPSQHFRILGDATSSEKTSCWYVLQHKPSDTGIVYSEGGPIPGWFWGLVMLSKPYLGDDSAWYSSLERAFCESWGAGSIRVWDVVRKAVSGSVQVLQQDLTLDEACERLNELNAPYRQNPALLREQDGYFTVELRSEHRRAG